MANESREGALRMDQRKDEPADIFVMRAFCKALPHIDQATALAMADWMRSKALDARTWHNPPNRSSP